MERYRILLVPEPAGGLARRGRRRNLHGQSTPPEQRLESRLTACRMLLEALQRVNQRGPGPAGWAPVLDDPLAFLLDGMSDALLVRGPDGQTLFANRRAQDLQLGQRPFCVYEEFDCAGERWQGRGLHLTLPDGTLSFTLVSQQRRV